MVNAGLGRRNNQKLTKARLWTRQRSLSIAISALSQALRDPRKGEAGGVHGRTLNPSGREEENGECGYTDDIGLNMDVEFAVWVPCM